MFKEKLLPKSNWSRLSIEESFKFYKQLHISLDREIDADNIWDMLIDYIVEDDDDDTTSFDNTAIPRIKWLFSKTQGRWWLDIIDMEFYVVLTDHRDILYYKMKWC